MMHRNRLDRVEAELRATVLHLTDVLTARLRNELSIPERRAFAGITSRLRELRTAGVACPLLAEEEDVEVDGGTLRLAGCGPELGTVDEWPLYRRVVERVRAVWKELDGPPDFWREGKHDPPSTG